MKVNINETKLLVSGTERETLKSIIDPCGMHGKRVMANSTMCIVDPGFPEDAKERSY